MHRPFVRNRHLQFIAATAICLFWLLGSPTQAAITIDPNSAGATDVVQHPLATPVTLTNPLAGSLDLLGVGIAIGNTANGELRIDNGSNILNSSGYIGREAGSTGVVTVSNVDSEWYCTRDFVVGDSGNGTLNITDGGVVTYTGNMTADGYIGYGPASNGIVHVDGVGSTLDYGVYYSGSLASSGKLTVGYLGTGILNITNGGTVYSRSAYIGYSYGPSGDGTVTIDGAGSLWTSHHDGGLVIGNGTLNIMNGGQVQRADWGSAIAAEGTVNVDGANSLLDNFGTLYISGKLNISNGGRVSYISVECGTKSGSTGMVSVDGVGSRLGISNNLSLGDGGNGTLSISNSGLVYAQGKLAINPSGAGNSYINMSSGGMLEIFGNNDGSLASFLDLIDGTPTIRYWNAASMKWAPITSATEGKDYTLERDFSRIRLTVFGDPTIVPEPNSVAICLLGMLAVTRCARRGW